MMVEKINRRELLSKMTATGVGVSVSGAVAGSAAAKRTTHPNPEEELIPNRELYFDLASIHRNAEYRSLHQEFLSRGFTPRWPDAFGLPVPVEAIEEFENSLEDPENSENNSDPILCALAI